MSASRRETRVGWCPSIATPMDASDGLLVRVKPTAATISANAVRALVDASVNFGNGEIDLTNRANLQIRGLRPDTVNAFAGMARKFGLASPDGALEEVRNVAADPLGADDPDAAFDSHAIARSIEAMLMGDSTLRALPPKFGFLVDCGRTLPVRDARADVIVRTDEDRLAVSIDGATLAIFCTAAEVPGVAQRLAQAYLALAGPPDTPPYRMRELVAELGADPVFAEAGLTGELKELQQPPRDHQFALMYAAPPADSPVGWLPFPNHESGALVAGVPRGRIEAGTLANLAKLAERYADGTLRTTPWRAVALVPVRTADGVPLAKALCALGLITDPADPRRALRGHDIAPAGNAKHQKAATP